MQLLYALVSHQRPHHADALNTKKAQRRDASFRLLGVKGHGKVNIRVNSKQAKEDWRQH
jgi:hypothetical protein